MILGIIGLGIIILIGFFIKSLDFNPFNFIFGIKKNKTDKLKSKEVDPNLTWEQWENENH